MSYTVASMGTKVQHASAQDSTRTLCGKDGAVALQGANVQGTAGELVKHGDVSCKGCVKALGKLAAEVPTVLADEDEAVGERFAAALADMTADLDPERAAELGVVADLHDAQCMELAQEDGATREQAIVALANGDTPCACVAVLADEVDPAEVDAVEAVQGDALGGLAVGTDPKGGTVRLHRNTCDKLPSRQDVRVALVADAYLPLATCCKPSKRAIAVATDGAVPGTVRKGRVSKGSRKTGEGKAAGYELVTSYTDHSASNGHADRVLALVAEFVRQGYSQAHSERMAARNAK